MPPLPPSSPDYDTGLISLDDIAQFSLPTTPPTTTPTRPVSSSVPSVLTGIDVYDFPIDDDWEADLLDASETETTTASVAARPTDEPPLLVLHPTPSVPPLGWSPRSWCRCTVVQVTDDKLDQHGWYAKACLHFPFGALSPC